MILPPKVPYCVSENADLVKNVVKNPEFSYFLLLKYLCVFLFKHFLAYMIKRGLLLQHFQRISMLYSSQIVDKSVESL